MIISLTLLLGAVGFLFYIYKDGASLVESDQLERLKDQKDKDDLYNDLEDLFI